MYRIGAIHKTTNSRNYSVTAKTSVDNNKNAPLIHVIQEIHQNLIRSEVRVNNRLTKHRESNKKDKRNLDGKKTGFDFLTENKSKHNLSSSEFESAPIKVSDLSSEEHQTNLKESNIKEKYGKGGLLLQKRIYTDISNRSKTPPKKPPRLALNNKRLQLKKPVTSFKDAERILDQILESNRCYDMKKDSCINVRKSFPFERKEALTNSNKINSDKFALSCPSLSEVDDSSKITGPKITWKSPRISKMLNYDYVCEEKPRQSFLYIKPEARPQMGWIFPPKQDIGTVYGIMKRSENIDDFQNFVKNMESSSTPIKSAEFINQEKFASNSTQTNDLSTCFTVKGKHTVSDFFKSSKKTFLSLFRKKHNKERFHNKSVTKNAAVQTSIDNIYKYDYAFEKKIPTFNIQSPKSSTSAKNSGFDFNRRVPSPKSRRSFQGHLSFSPKNFFKSFRYRNDNYHKTAACESDQINKSCETAFKDDSLVIMNNVLLDIEAKLESSDGHSSNIYLEIEPKEKLGASFLENYRKKKVMSVEVHRDVEDDISVFSDRADVHPNTIYSEIEKVPFVVTQKPSKQYVNEITHYFVDDNPQAEYAEIKKIMSKKTSNNGEKCNSPTLTNKTKPEISLSSEIVLESLSQPSEKIEAIRKISHPSRNVSKLIAYFETSVCDKDEIIDDDKNADVSYQSPNESFYTKLPDLQKDDKADSCLNHEFERYVSESVVSYDVVSDVPSCANNCTLPELVTTSKLSNNGQSFFNDTNGAQKSIKPNPNEKYEQFKNTLRTSFRKGKSFLQNQTTRRFNFKTKDGPLNRSSGSTYDAWDESNLGITQLYSLDNDYSVQEKLQKAVHMCRHVPLLKSSMEAVEAERLLLYSHLKLDKLKNTSEDIFRSGDTFRKDSWMQIDEFEFSINFNSRCDAFFNYFYIGVFSNGSEIKSTKYAEKHGKRILFRDCNLLLQNLDRNSKIKCDVYVLRLRKILDTNSTRNEINSNMESIKSSSDSGDELLSRFILQGSFQFEPHNFIPYIRDRNCERIFRDNNFCLHSTQTASLPLELVKRSRIIQSYVTIKSKLEVVFKKLKLEGFLNVRDVTTKHDWNRRWCKIDIFNFCVWNYPQDCTEQPSILTIDLTQSSHFEIKSVDKGICPRPRSFSLQLQSDDDCQAQSQSVHHEEIFFSAENEDDLEYWLNGLNSLLRFIQNWIIKEE